MGAGYNRPMKLIPLFLIVLFSHSLYAGSTLLFIGDSLTEGYGVPKEKAYPSLVAKELEKKGKTIKLLNGSVSGSTTASGLSRLRWFLKAKPSILILALGANDGLRGVKLSDSEKNLRKIIELAKENKIKVVLAGMLLPTNYGEAYRTDFEKMYKKLEKEFSLVKIPFLLEKVGGEAKYNQEDGIHPNVAGHEIIAQTVLKTLDPLL
ncbi:MAG: acyl-CoA thioesterase-1 [Bacteriovoracaceae bacterium]|jgi:acyl-CoA thioesterase-1